MPSQEQKTTDQEQKQMQVVWIEPKKFVKKHTLAQMAIDNYEKKQQEKLLKEEENNLKNITAARRFLYSIGQYELEEGEILE